MINVRSNFREIRKELGHFSQAQIKRASVRGLNVAAKRVRIDSGKKIVEAVDIKRGGKRLITDNITAWSAGASSLSAVVTFREQGIGVESTRKASTRKVRGKGSRHTVKFNGKRIAAFSFGSESKRFIRSKNRIKRLFSYTLLQEARKANVFEDAQVLALDSAIKEFTRTLKVFK